MDRKEISERRRERHRQMMRYEVPRPTTGELVFYGFAFVFIVVLGLLVGTGVGTGTGSSLLGWLAAGAVWSIFAWCARP